MQKQRVGGRPGPFYHVNDVSVYQGRQRGEGSLIKKNKLEALSCSFYPKLWSLNEPLLVQNEEQMRKMRFLKKKLSGPPLPLLSVYPGRQDVIHVIK